MPSSTTSAESSSTSESRHGGHGGHRRNGHHGHHGGHRGHHHHHHHSHGRRSHSSLAKGDDSHGRRSPSSQSHGGSHSSHSASHHSSRGAFPVVHGLTPEEHERARSPGAGLRDSVSDRDALGLSPGVARFGGESLATSFGIHYAAALADDRREEAFSMASERTALIVAEAPRVLRTVREELRVAFRDLSPAAVPAHQERGPSGSQEHDSAGGGDKPAPGGGPGSSSKKRRNRVAAIGGAASLRTALLTLPPKAGRGSTSADSKSSQPRATDSVEAPVVAPPKFSKFSSPNGLVTGLLRTEGVSVAACEIVVRSEEFSHGHQWRKGQALQTRIGDAHVAVAEHPSKKKKAKVVVPTSRLIHLPQLKNAYQYTRLALEVLDEVEALCKGFSEAASVPHAHAHGSNLVVDAVDHVCVTAVSTLLADASRYLQLTMQAFLVPPRRHAFPDEADPLALRLFDPPLPRDLVLELSLQRRNLVITAYCLHLLRPQDVDKATLRDSGIHVGETFLDDQNALEVSPVGRTVLWTCCGESQHAEVVDYGVAEIPVPAMSQTFARIAAVYDACAELQEKLCTFR
jgi:Rogdi leucine zipper containing protein